MGIRFETTCQSVFTWNKIIVNRFKNRYSTIIFFKEIFCPYLQKEEPSPCPPCICWGYPRYKITRYMTWHTSTYSEVDLRWNSWTSIVQKTQVFCSILFTVPSTADFKDNHTPILCSGFKNPYKKIRETWTSLCRRKNEGRKADENSSLRRLEFMPRNPDENAIQEFHLLIQSEFKNKRISLTKALHQ